MQPGKNNNTVHLVRRGIAKLSLYSSKGQEKILFFARPGDLIGGPVCDHKSPAATIVIAVTPNLQTRSWLQQDIDKILRQHPELAVLFMKLQSRHIQYLTSQIEKLAFVSSRARVIDSLLQLAALFGESDQDKGGITIKLNFTQADLAKLAAVSRVTASKTITHLRRKGLLSKKQKHFRIHNLQLLGQMRDH